VSLRVLPVPPEVLLVLSWGQMLALKTPPGSPSLPEGPPSAILGSSQCTPGDSGYCWWHSSPLKVLPVPSRILPVLSGDHVVALNVPQFFPVPLRVLPVPPEVLPVPSWGQLVALKTLLVPSGSSQCPPGDRWWHERAPQSFQCPSGSSQCPPGDRWWHDRAPQSCQRSSASSQWSSGVRRWN